MMQFNPFNFFEEKKNPGKQGTDISQENASVVLLSEYTHSPMGDKKKSVTG